MKKRPDYHALQRLKLAWWPLLCVGAPLIAFILVHPVLEMGFNDDWGFYHMALVLARTGRVSYEGWTTPMSLPHVFWGAALIRIFGFSWLGLRIGMLPFWAGSGLLVYLLGRKIGLPHFSSALASLVTTLSPVTVPLGASYHSDVTALGFILLAVYCGVQAVGAATPRRAAGWAAAMAIAGGLAGITRDVDWAVPVWLVLVFVLLRWRERQLRVLGFTVLTIVLVAAAASFRWHYSQPNAPAQEPFGNPWPDAVGFARILLYIGLTIGLFCLPMMMSLVRRIRYLRPWPSAIALLFLAAAGLAAGGEPRLLFPPWIGNMFTEYGSFYNHQLLIGFRQIILTPPLRLVLGCIVLGISALFAGAATQVVSGQYRACFRKALEEREPLLILAALTLPFAFSYIGLLALRAPVFLGFSGYNNLFDRYLLPIVPIAALIVGAIAWRLRAGGPGVATPAALLLMAAFAVANTHDLYAEHRAILAGAQWVTSRGIPRDLVSGGYEYDGWTQLEEKGLPSGGERGAQDPNALTVARKLPVMIWFQYATDAVTPCYYVVASPQPVLSTVHEVEYRAWLPPEPRRILVQQSGGDFASARNCPALRKAGWTAQVLIRQPESK